MDRGIITISETGAVTMPTTPVWMTLFEIADLFGVFSSDVRKIIRSAYKSRGRKINCVMRRFFPSSSVGDRPAPRGCTSTPDERKVTTI